MKFRSGFEKTVYGTAVAEGFELDYETIRLSYLVQGNYYPDFVLPNGIIVEVKGYFDARARAKMIAVKKANPTLDIRMLFMNARTKVRKGSKMTYADWADKYGFPYAEHTIPVDWFNEGKKPRKKVKRSKKDF